MNRFGVQSLLSLVVGSALALSAGTGPPTSRPTAVAATQPSPNLTPLDVVRIQLTALRNNDQPAPDSGVATAFAFASPSDRKVIGPLSHFTELLKSPTFAPMIGFRTIAYAPTRILGNGARQLVLLTDSHGHDTVYLFVLSIQPDGPYKGCWMTDGVVHVNISAKDEDDLDDDNDD
jgi:hypothetical protein